MTRKRTPVRMARLVAQWRASGAPRRHSRGSTESRRGPFGIGAANCRAPPRRRTPRQRRPRSCRCTWRRTRRRRCLRSCSAAESDYRFGPPRRPSWSGPRWRRSARRADDLAGGPHLSGDRGHGLAAIHRRLVRPGARALHAGPALGPPFSVSESARGSAEDSRVGSIGLLGALQAARARHVRLADRARPRAGRNGQRRSPALVVGHGCVAHAAASLVRACRVSACRGCCTAVATDL